MSPPSAREYRIYYRRFESRLYDSISRSFLYNISLVKLLGLDSANETVSRINRFIIELHISDNNTFANVFDHSVVKRQMLSVVVGR